jgi:hypothetical protein
MTRSQSANNPVKLNDEGELVGGIFCEYCGELNRAEAVECERCHEHIADQGPDLRARLQRISRHASSSQGFSDIADGGIGSETYVRPHSSFKKLMEVGALLGGVLFLLFLVSFLVTPSANSRQLVFVIGFFAVTSMFFYLSVVMCNLSLCFEV